MKMRSRLFKCSALAPLGSASERPFDGFHQLGARAPNHQADGILAITAGMRAELAEHAISLAAASSAAEEDFEHLALQQLDRYTPSKSCSTAN